MTIGGWAWFTIVAVIILAIGGAAAWALFDDDKKGAGVACIIAAMVLCVLAYAGFSWYFQNTASGRRALTDQRSELSNGLERTITVYTADGSIIATYTGKIDIAENDGGYIKFDFDGKRYIYYNCFVESVADIG